MGVNDRMFGAPAPDLARIHARLAALSPHLRGLVEQAGNALARGDLQNARAALANALSIAPGQPDVLRLHGLLLSGMGDLHAAVADFEAALRAAPDDAMGYWQYAQVLEQGGDVAAAWRLRERAVQRLPDSPMAWHDLGEHLARHRQPERAVAPLERAVRLAPGYAPSRLKLGDALVSLGRTAEGAATIRDAIAIEPAFGAAWLDLVDIKTVPVTEDERERMRAVLRGNDIDAGERTAVGFALAKACEDCGRYAEAYALLVEANARRRREVRPWDVDRFLALARRSEEVFAAPLTPAGDPQRGDRAIFVVGLPRSGTTLVEQILAAHPQVQALGERGELAQVLAEESARVQRLYPEWVPAATPHDWRRLGRRYLELTEPLGEGRQRLADKMPNNWQAVGAIRAMLPGARIVMCRRDPLENCWSCFKQYFAQGWAFTSDIDQLALFWKVFDRTATQWAARDAAHVRAQGYEAITENPAAEIRALLAFCDLPFDAACLHAHESPRSIHTLSAAQVREPIHRHRALAEHYGGLLDPLRRALGIPIAPAGGPAQGGNARG